MSERGMTLGDRFIVAMMVIGAMAATAHLDWTRGQQIKAIENRVAAIEAQTSATAALDSRLKECEVASTFLMLDYLARTDERTSEAKTRLAAMKEHLENAKRKLGRLDEFRAAEDGMARVLQPPMPPINLRSDVVTTAGGVIPCCVPKQSDLIQVRSTKGDCVP